VCSRIAHWSHTAWALLYAGSLSAFVHILLRPGTGYVSDARESPTAVAVALFIAFGVLSVAFWAYFQIRPRREPTRELRGAGL
jgi:hypothetical protein